MQNRPIINFLSATPDGAMFLDVIDTSEATKNSKYIADALIEQIEDVGKANIGQVVRNSASNCVATRKQLADKYPNIFLQHVLLIAKTCFSKTLANYLGPVEQFN